MLFLHIISGALGLISGFIAIFAAKGARVHRKSGMVFVYTMLAMTGLGTAIAAIEGVAPALNVPAGLVTAYLVTTSLTTIRPPGSGARLLHIAALLVALTVGVIALRFGFEAVANGGMRNDLPAFPFFMFGTVAVLASISDVRVLRSGPLQGAPRLARHLWRMSFALFIASMSFFFGQSDEIPQPLRIMPLLALPVVAVLLTMLYWLWRVRVRRALRGILPVRAPSAT